MLSAITLLAIVGMFALSYSLFIFLGFLFFDLGKDQMDDFTSRFFRK